MKMLKIICNIVLPKINTFCKDKKKLIIKKFLSYNFNIKSLQLIHKIILHSIFRYILLIKNI